MARLKLFGAKTEQFQDGWGDLRRLYRRCDIQAASCSGPYQQDRDVAVLGVITTMLGDFGLMTGVDDPVLSNADHVGYPRITLFNADELRRSQARIYLPKTGRRDRLAVAARRGIVGVPRERPPKLGGPRGP